MTNTTQAQVTGTTLRDTDIILSEPNVESKSQSAKAKSSVTLALGPETYEVIEHLTQQHNKALPPSRSINVNQLCGQYIRLGLVLCLYEPELYASLMQQPEVQNAVR